MPHDCLSKCLEFHALTLADREAVQAVTLDAGLRNCNFNFSNLFGWQPEFGTEVAFCEGHVVLRYRLGSELNYLIASKETPCRNLLERMVNDATAQGATLAVRCLEDGRAAAIVDLFPGRATATPQRNSYDYIYLRTELANLAGKSLKNKRNHVNKFLSEHPAFEYRELSPALFPQCLELVRLWQSETPHDNPDYGDTIAAEERVMQRIFDHWGSLDAIGGAIFDAGRMLAFTYGAPVTHDTFDVCVEKADRFVDGAFSVINQQFAAHLPEQYVYLNREEDMGLPGLRKAKLSYHPEILLSYNSVTINPL